MDFPIGELMNREACLDWIERYFHPEGVSCPHCEASIEEAGYFRQTKLSELKVYRCKACQGIYNLYSGTVFEARYFRPEQVVLFIRGVCQGKATAQLARELSISRTTATEVRHLLQANAEQAQPQTKLADSEVETDEMFQNAGGKK
jgi:transposase-like protein